MVRYKVASDSMWKFIGVRTSAACFALSMLLLFLITTKHVAAADLNRPSVAPSASPIQQANSVEKEIVGTVVQRPSDPDGYGEWQIATDNGLIVYLNAMSDQSYFLSASPKVNDIVYVTLQAPIIDSAGAIATMMRLDREATSVPTDDGNLVHIVLHGSVITSPLSTNGVGQWKVYSEGLVYDVGVYDETSFPRGIPNQGRDVYITGWTLKPQNISAEVFAIDDGTVHYEVAERLVTQLSGQVIGAPTATVDGMLWRIRNRATVYSVRSDSDTQFAPVVPESGDYVDLLVTSAGEGQPSLAIMINISANAIGEIALGLRPEGDITALADAYHLTNVETIMQSANIYRLSSSNPTAPYLAYLAKELEREPAVLWADLNYIGTLPIAGHPNRTWGWGSADDSSYVNQAAFTQITMGDVLTTYRGDEQIVAVLDTGVDLRHTTLQPYLLNGFDFVDDDRLPDDDGPGLAQGHGTHVSGIVAHIAPDSRILPVRVLDPDGRGDVIAVVSAIEWAVNRGADVINLSLGTDGDAQVLHEAIRWATDRGVSVVAAAGNENSAELHYPAAYTETLSVTAVDESIAKADFANYGDWVDMAAPGVGITSTIVSAQGSGYASWSGTSMATPFISGAIALLREKYPTMTPAEIKAHLILRGQIVNATDSRYMGLLGSFLNVERSMADDPPGIIYLPLILVFDPAPFLIESK